MDHSRARVDPSVNQSLRDGVLTLAALFLVFAAFDDITTDNATSFRAEYSALIACACWLSFVAMRLISTRHLILGGVSVLALAGAAWGQGGIRPGIVPVWPEYIVLIAAYLWFLALALVLLWRGRPPRPRNAS